MDAKKLSDAFEGIDDKYKQEADIFYDSGRAAKKKGWLFPVLKGAAGTVAAVALVAGLLWLGRLQKAPVGTNAGSAGSDASSETAEAEISIDKDGRLHFADELCQQAYDLMTEQEYAEHKMRALDTVPFPAEEVRQSLLILLPRVVWTGTVEGKTRWLITADLEGYYFLDGETRKHVEPLLSMSFILGTEDGTVLVDLPQGPGTDLQSDLLPALREFTGLPEEDVTRLLLRETGSSGMGQHLSESSQQLMEEYARLNGLEEYLSPEPEASPTPLPVREPIPGSVTMDEAAMRVAADLVDEWLQGMNGQYPDELQECFFQDLQITHIRDDGDSFVFSMRLVFKPTDATQTSGWWWAGNTKEGTGENEGYYTASRSVLVNRIDDQWQFADWGTNYGGWGDRYTEAEEYFIANQITRAQLLELAREADAEADGLLTTEDFEGLARWRVWENDTGIEDPPYTWAVPVPGGFTLYVDFAGEKEMVASALASPYGSGCTLADGPEAVAKVLAGEDPFPDATPAPTEGPRQMTLEDVLALAERAEGTSPVNWGNLKPFTALEPTEGGLPFGETTQFAVAGDEYRLVVELDLHSAPSFLLLIGPEGQSVALWKGREAVADFLAGKEDDFAHAMTAGELLELTDRIAEGTVTVGDFPKKVTRYTIGRHEDQAMTTTTVALVEGGGYLTYWYNGGAMITPLYDVTFFDGNGSSIRLDEGREAVETFLNG